MMRFRVAILALSAVCAPALSAQSDAPGPLAIAIDSADDFSGRELPTGCLVSITPSSMYRETVFLEARMPAHTDSSLTTQADLMAQDVAADLRTLLGAQGDDVPNADSLFSWYTVPSQLIVVAHADGSMTRRIRTAGRDSTAALLFARAFDSARAQATALMLWPENFAADSVVVRLTLVPSFVDNKHDVVTTEGRRVRFAAFYLSAPMETPALPKLHQGQPRYPFFNQQNRVTGTLILQFVVDTNGRADSTTIHDLWTPGVPRLTGELDRYYRDFVRTTSTWVKHIHFYPARVGSCPVRQIVQFPFRFVTRESERAEAQRTQSH
jgi:hypothetical protein